MSPLAIPKGFRFAGLCAGVKASKKDLMLVASDRPAVGAGVFTTNQARAASVRWCAARLPSARVRACVAVSGCANAATGPQGEAANARMAAAVADALGVTPDQVLTAATGAIGTQLPVEKIEAAAPALVAALGDDSAPAQEAILTTDTRAKSSVRTVRLGGADVVVAGFAKGAGMIHPTMATTLAYVVTDAAASPSWLDAVVREIADETFNMVSVDRDTSTNDSLVVLANGASGAPPVEGPGADAEALTGALREVLTDLCRAIAADGEGATRLVTTVVRGAPTLAGARLVARAVVASNLVKAAFYGADPGWGRVLSAAASAGAPLDPECVTLRIMDTVVFARGAPAPFEAAEVRRRITGATEVLVDLDLGTPGGAAATAWGCDLSYEYVRINADYAAVMAAPQTGATVLDPRLASRTTGMKVSLLVEALSYIERFKGTRVVVKYGGAAMVQADLKDRFARDVRLLTSVGMIPVVVHGGGPEISRALSALSLPSEWVDGLRVTGETEMGVIERVLTGQVNKDVVGRLSRAGVRAVGVSGKDGGLIVGRRLPPVTPRDGGPARDLGLVGEVERVDPAVIDALVAGGFVPIISPVAVSDEGETLNINADATAAAIAVAIKARKLLYLTDVAGVLRDGVVVPEMTPADLTRGISDGTFSGGMLPKAASIIAAISGGVETVHIIDGRVPHNLISELFTDDGVGTMIRNPPAGASGTAAAW
jgi:acetylglutamate kinase